MLLRLIYDFIWAGWRIIDWNHKNSELIELKFNFGFCFKLKLKTDKNSNEWSKTRLSWMELQISSIEVTEINFLACL